MPWSVAFGLCAFATVATAEVIPVPCGPLRLGFDSATGHWCELSAAGSPANLLGASAAMDTEVQAEGQPWPQPSDWKASRPAVETVGDEVVVAVARESGPWSVVTTYGVSSRAPLIQRRVRLTWHGTAPLRVRGVVLRVPGVTLGGAPDARWCLPGIYPVQSHPLSASVAGRVTREPGWTWADTGVGYAGSNTHSLLLAYGLQQDHARVQAEEVPGGVSLGHHFETVANLSPGGALEVGTQWIEVASGGSAGLRRAARELAVRVNPGPPADRPAWLSGAALVELHPWGRLDAWAPGDRGDRMPSLEAQLPYLRDLGADAVWLLPVSNKPPWVYFLPSFRNLDPQVTTPEQLRSFIAAGHRVGVRTLLDLVTYGISPDSPDVRTLPDHVWCRNQKGELEKAWGGTVLAADVCDPDWRSHVCSLGSWWVREFGADGFRLDCGGCGQALNWQPPSGEHPNASVLAGGIEQNAQLRAAIRGISPDAVLMPEAGATCHFRSADLLFDYPFYMICRELTREPRTHAWVSQAREWLAAQQLTMSPRQVAGMVRFLELHDTVASPELFGVGPSQALTALCVFLPGTFLFQQEQEVGFAPELREWLRLRHQRPELRTGDADFAAVTADDPNVLAFLRQEGTATTVVAINFGAQATRCRLQWPGRQGEWRDLLTGQRLDPARGIPIPAYRPAVVSASSSRRAPTEAKVGATRRSPLLTAEPLAGGLSRTHLRLAPVSRWFVHTDEGLLVDEFVDRHRGTKPGETHVDATPPLARCWRPLEQGLWDVCETPSLGALAPDGRAVEVSITDLPALRRVRIEDPSCRGEAVEITLDAPAGSTPFRVVEHADGQAFLEGLRRLPCQVTRGRVTVDPLWVRASNSHYALALSRRHGGTIYDLRPAGATASWVDGSSEVYTDWGLFEQRLHVSTDGETNPRLEVAERGAATEVTFRGSLHGPSWNGVQTAPVANPTVQYRLTYRLDGSPAIGVMFGLTPTSDRPDTKAFFAYRLPFAGVADWSAEGGPQPAGGSTGAHPGQRVYQATDLGPALSGLVLKLQFASGALQIRAMGGDPAPPQNPFLLDGGPGALQLFFALLNGGSVALQVGHEYGARFELVLP